MLHRLLADKLRERCANARNAAFFEHVRNVSGKTFQTEVRVAYNRAIFVYGHEWSAKPMTQNENLQSGVVASPADAMLSRAISETLKAPASDRVRLFEQFVREIESEMAAHPVGRPWTCKVYTGTDGSRIFRGGIGHSLVIDLDGRLWRARSYEDFETTYAFTEKTCEIDTLTPLFDQMREYLSQ